jgi:putative transposase
MKLWKTIKTKVYRPTKVKYNSLLALMNSWNQGLELKREYKVIREKTDLPSCYCSEMVRFVKTEARPPVGIPAIALNLHHGTKFAPWFASIPTPLGRIHVPLRLAAPHSRLLEENTICQTRLLLRSNEFFLYISVMKETEPPTIYDNAPVLSVDLGERIIATSVTLVDGHVMSPRFSGKDVRGIRRHYAWLRKRLGERKLIRLVKRIGHAEHEKVEQRLHRISKEIVSEASSMGAIIAIGNMYGIKKAAKGKRFKRIVHSMPYSRLTHLIMYKAAWADVPVILVDEDYSSRECHICGQDGVRLSQSRFRCPSCGEFNADINGAINIGKRALAYIAIAGAPGFEPERRLQKGICNFKKVEIPT